MYARSFCLDSCVETMEVYADDVAMADIEQKGSTELTSNRETGPGTASVGGVAGERHHAALVSVRFQQS